MVQPASLPSPKRDRAFVATIACVAGLSGCLQPSELQIVGFDDEGDAWVDEQRYVPFVTVPDALGGPTSEERLAASLGAFASAVEGYMERYELAPPPVEFQTEALTLALTKIVEEVEGEAMLSIHVRDLASNETIFDYYGDTPLNPASNLKIVTASAAIDLLGPDYTFATEILMSPDTLVLVGAGDPSLKAEDIEVMIAEVIDKVAVTGLERIVVDDRIFSQRKLGPGYRKEGPGYSYEAISGALSLNFNTVVVTVYPVRGSSRPGVRVEPPSTHVVVENGARIGGASARITVETKPRGDRTVVTVGGRMPAGARPVSIRRRVYDPSRFVAGAVSHRLAELSSTEPLPVEIGEAPRDAEVIVIHDSAPLIEIADDLLAYSNNFMAEQLVRTLGWRMTGEPGDWVNGLDVLRGYWSAMGNDPDALIVENASGMSEVGRATTSGLVDLIAMGQRYQGSGASLVDALPIAGLEGTLRARLRFSGKRVRAKTGTLDGVSGLSGVVTAEDGRPQVAFSILINVKDGVSMYAKERRRIEDRVVMEVLRYLDDFEARRGFLSFEPLWVYATAQENELVAIEGEGEGDEVPSIESPTLDDEAGVGAGAIEAAEEESAGGKAAEPDESPVLEAEAEGASE